MEDKKDQDAHILDIISKLKAEGKTWPQISQVLAEEGLKDKRGKPISAAAAQSRYLRSQKVSKKKDVQAEEPASYQYERGEQVTPIDMDDLALRASEIVMNKTIDGMKVVILETIEMKLAAMCPPPPVPIDLDELVRKTTDNVMNTTTESLKAFIQVAIDERMATMTPPIPVPEQVPISEDFPPEPRIITGAGKGRRETRKYARISLTVDANLWKLVQADMERLKVSAGRMVDILLWRAYGKPKLSFEEEEIEHQEEGQVEEANQTSEAEEPGHEE